MGIHTPDRRLRVFVSSTLTDLADERRAVRHAISSLRLTPVMFEVGARPHPPQDLYRAYLAQSDVFVGLYWQRYGWVGPGMDISGLHDELRLARRMPRLLYVKEPAPEREPRLVELLEQVVDEAADSFRPFSTTAELGRLIRDDLAMLLSERFVAGQPSPAASPRSLPVDTTTLVGREPAIDEVVRLVDRGRLVTLTGPGGIGKTRLAVAVGERLRPRFGVRMAFISCADVARPDLALGRIGRAVQAGLGGAAAPLDALVERFDGAPWLLILDNLEQVLDLAHELDELLARCPGVTILVTSRRVLRLRAEREYEVPALALPTSLDDLDDVGSSPAVALFVDRARAVRHDFALTEDNAADVVAICRRLEGLPLAIELAAARIRLVDPDTVARRLTESLGALGPGPVDLPERQRTLRATVEWSISMLTGDERALLEAMAAFVDGWTVEAAAPVAGLSEEAALDLTEALHRNSLVHVHRTPSGPRSRMLETVREFVAAHLAARPDAPEIHRRHAEYFRRLAERADRPLRGAGQREWGDRLQVEAGNLAAAVRWHLAYEPAPLPHLFRVMWPFLALWEHLDEVRLWVERLVPAADRFDPQARAELFWARMVTGDDIGDDELALGSRERLAPLVDRIDDPYLHALATLGRAWTAPIDTDLDDALRELTASLDELRRQDEPFWTAVALQAAGALETTAYRFDAAAEHLGAAMDLATRLDNTWLAAWSRTELGILEAARGRLPESRALLDEGLELSLHTHNTRSVSLCLGGYAKLAFAQGDVERAALLSGAADGLRKRIGLQLWPILRRRRGHVVGSVHAALGDERFQRAYGAGFHLSQRDAVAVAREAPT